MKKLLFVALIVILAGGLLVGCGSAETVTQTQTATTTSTATETITTKELRLATNLPADDPMIQSIQEAADNFNAAVGGRYKIELYTGGVLGGMVEAFDLTAAGAIDICEFSPDFIASKDPVFAAHGLPFALKDQAAGNKFFTLIRDAVWQDTLRDKYNVELISICAGNCHEYLGTQPIHTMDDWKGKVIWVAGPTEADTVEALGASGTVLDWSEGPSAMEKGVVDGTLQSGFAAWFMKWDMLSYATRATFNVAACAITMNLDQFNELPKDVQDILLQEFDAHSERMRVHWAGMETLPFDELGAQGWEVYNVPDAERAKWVEVTESIIDDYYSQLSPENAEIVRNCMAEANK